MTIEFEINIPDEPYKMTYSKGNKVKLTYTGPKFLVISVDSSSKRVHTYEYAADKLEEINLENFKQDNKEFHILDTLKHPLIASLLTYQYESAEYPDYEEELPTGETWVYFYENKILDNVYSNIKPVYLAEEDKFTSLVLLEPALTKEQFNENLKNNIERIEKIVASKSSTDITSENIDKLTEHLNWLKNVENNYPGIDHWKIPFPPEPVI